MAKKKSLSFEIKKSLLVGAVGATTLASQTGCMVNPAPEPWDEETEMEADAGDDTDVDQESDADDAEEADGDAGDDDDQ